LTDRHSIKSEILNLLHNEHLRITPLNLEQAIRRKLPGTKRHLFREVVQSLCTQGQLSYTQHFSTTHLEINYTRPFQVSDRIVLAPNRVTESIDSNCMVIKLQDGYTFGAGDHPTTRMILRALDFIIGANHAKGESQVQQALDIGTGTGVLAIAAAALGVDRVVAIDIDPMACIQAKKNVGINGFKNTVHVSQQSLDNFLEHRFDIVMANLRPPTTRQLISKMLAVSSHQAKWVISGCRVEERKRLENLLPPEMSEVIWEEHQHEWAAFAVKREFGPT
jgi:ribosomal protein L11 methyltransferase